MSANDVEIESEDTQETDGPWRRARKKVRLETSDMVLYADEVDYNTETQYVEARGSVHYKNFIRNEEIRASKVEYHLDDETGKFYDVQGSAKMRIESRPGVLASTSPFHFEGKWAERLREKYVLHQGMITNCKMPNPMWTLRGPKFDIVPNEHAIAYRAVFRVRRLPLFYTPFFYKSLARSPRRSGFLTPNIGNSSRRGKMFGVGYYWAINRSYDATYRLQEFTARGLAHHLELRGKPTQRSDFNAVVYGVQDRGLQLEDGERRKEGGYTVQVDGKAELAWGFHARGTVNYLSSLVFRQAFTETFHEAIFSEVHSVGYVGKQWSTFDVNLVFARIENFQSVQAGDSIVIRKLPELQFSSRDRKIWKDLPFWFSFDSAAGLLRRTQPLYQTRQFIERADVQPRIMTALRWKGFSLLPAFSIRGTHYGESQDSEGRISGANFNRGSREVFVDLVVPSLERVFRHKTLFGEQLKHVIEPRASFRHVSGVLDFDRLIRFDETELVSNTTEAEVSVANRFYAKRKGVVSEVLSWQVWQRRYFDPAFGGAVVEGGRNVISSAIGLTPYAFLSGPRDYSPVVSVLRATPAPGLGIEWR
ncbi:MAG: LPS assembly protein LptD, partial [Bryobacteraceae bacterium]